MIMNKVFNNKSIIAITTMIVFGTFGAASASRQTLVRTNYGYKTNYGQQEEYVYPVNPFAIRDWYFGAKFNATFANFTNEYSTESNPGFGGDKYSFSPMIGGSLVFGHRTLNNWRIEGEVGHTGIFSDEEKDVVVSGGTADITFSISAPYLSMNAIYDGSTNTNGGFYIGGGLGAAMATTKIESIIFLGSNETVTKVSPYGAFMMGYSWPVDNKLTFDIGYRLSGFQGTSHSREWLNPGIETFTSDTGLVLCSSLSAGLRYNF